VNDLPAGILIDLDDTILDDSGSVERCWADAGAEAARRVPGLDAVALQDAIAAHASWWWSDSERTKRGRLDLQAATLEIFGDVMQGHGCIDADIVTGIAKFYRALRNERATVFEGAIETLVWLRARGVRLGLMTNGGGPAQRAKIERFGLAPYFEHIVIEGELGCGKPDRRVFETLLRALRVKPRETWAVGDNIEVDVFGAMDVGIRGIWVDASGRGLPAEATRLPDRVIASLSELVNGGSEHG
jgi:putative hydrolase of the HAD superfamily